MSKRSKGEQNSNALISSHSRCGNTGSADSDGGVIEGHVGGCVIVPGQRSAKLWMETVRKEMMAFTHFAHDSKDTYAQLHVASYLFFPSHDALSDLDCRDALAGGKSGIG